MQDLFNQKKGAILKEIGATNGGIPDASPKGTIDEKCIPIINTINRHEDMVTTSTCSGRVSVFLEGIKDGDGIKIGAKGKEGRWIFVTHNAEDLDSWYKSVDFKYCPDEHFTALVNTNSRFILYKFEPLILHVKCRNLETANTLYTTAMNCGFRESGIGNNNIVAIRISIKLDIPIGYAPHDSLVSFVTEDYLELITKLSHDRFAENFKKLDILHHAIKDMNVPVQAPKETKDERRLRKIQEGMARQEGVRALKEQKKKEKEAANEAKSDVNLT